MLDLPPVGEKSLSGDSRKRACNTKTGLSDIQGVSSMDMLTIIAARAIIPGVTSWSPHCTPFGGQPGDFFLPESDEGPKRITFNIYVQVSMTQRDTFAGKVHTIANAGLMNRLSLSCDPSG